MRQSLAASLVLLALTFAGCADNASTGHAPEAAATPAAAPAAIADKAADAHPLGVGEKAPAMTIASPEGTPVSLADLYAEGPGPTMLIFYRGSWCPFCTRHLADVAQHQDRLAATGVRIVAISPDTPDASAKLVADQGLPYTVLCDPDADAIAAFGLAFKQRDRVLPVPAVYLVDTAGVIRFVHTNPDYKQRLTTDELVAAAESIK